MVDAPSHEVGAGPGWPPPSWCQRVLMVAVLASTVTSLSAVTPTPTPPWWTSRSIQKPPVPKPQGTECRNEIDAFIQATLRSHQLSPSREANRGTLIRRLYFDLWGLPPTPEAVRAFEQDPAPDAYERLVNDLLNSPHYGEHWARHWLDLVRYADSDGYRIDDFRPNAWRYRDYVIRSLNQDKPYNRFVQEQLAGDELWPEDTDALIATGFLRHGIYEYNNRDAVAQWSTLLNDITDTTAEVFLGVGLQCARCHDHKFDPLPQSDYYRFQAFFSALLPQEDTPVATPAERAAYVARLDLWMEKTESIRSQIREIESPPRQSASDDLRSKFPPETQALMRKPVDQRTPYEHQIAELAYRQITYAYERLTPRLRPEEKEKLTALRKQLAEYDSLLPSPLPMAMTAKDVGPTPPPTRIPRHPDTVIDPGFLSVIAPGPAQVNPLPQSPRSTGRRAALANWITRPDHPLTPRVMVNRVWQYHFGKGLVATSSDFGKLGEPPTHPELLDWLAAEFVSRGWSLKHLHRLMVTSHTYRQATAPSEEVVVESASSRTTPAPTKGPDQAEADRWQHGQTVDPENRLLWHGQARRLSAEQLRDALLLASGELKPGSPGPSVDASKAYRSIYGKVLRNTRDPLQDTFDAPQNFTSTCSRDATTTPIQSLLLLNSAFMQEKARTIAARIDGRFPNQASDRIRAAYQTLLGRAPTPSEIREAEEFLESQERLVDPELAVSAAASFASAKIPYRDGRAAVIQLKGGNDNLDAPLTRPYPAGSKTIEGFVLLRSYAEDASSRTILAGHDAISASPVWALAVTGKKFRGKPQSLVMEIASANSGEPSIVASELVIRLDRPYFVAAALDPVGGMVTFHAKDLSNEDEPLATTQVTVPSGLSDRTLTALTFGASRNGLQRWDGLIDDVRITRGLIGVEELQLRRPGTGKDTLGFWAFEPKPSYFKDRSALANDIEWRTAPPSTRLTAQFLAFGDFCHALLNSSEFLYVE
ncbi:MAG: DUF1549 domain-containing protein [Verrucomicrobiales bacterium]|nr:DUF1549 domain-containing protein [Verrucomicrobiales bacterium]